MKTSLFNEVAQKKSVVMEKLFELENKLDKKNISTNIRLECIEEQIQIVLDFIKEDNALGRGLDHFIQEKTENKQYLAHFEHEKSVQDFLLARLNEEKVFALANKGFITKESFIYETIHYNIKKQYPLAEGLLDENLRDQPDQPGTSRRNTDEAEKST